jgi:hypothetical protein
MSRKMQSISLVCGALAAGLFVSVACTTEDVDPDPVTGASGGGGGDGGAPAMMGSGGTTSAGGMTGAAGMPPTGAAICATVTVGAPEQEILMTGFEMPLDALKMPTTDPISNQFEVVLSDTEFFYWGFWADHDQSGTLTFAFTDEANSGVQALEFGLANSTVWGGLFGIWFGCYDATAFSGFSFAAKSNTPGPFVIEFPTEQTTTATPTNPADPFGTCAAATCTNWQFPFDVTNTYQTFNQTRLVGISIRPATGASIAAPLNVDLQLDDIMLVPN